MKKAAFVLALVMLMTCMAGCGKVEGEASVQSVSMICGLGSVGLADRFAGIVSPLGETKIKKDDSMAVSDIRVKVGDTVKEGDVLFTYDLSEARSNLEMAQLELEQLNATLEDQKAEVDRIQKLMDETYDDATKRQYSLDLRTAKVSVLTTQGNIATKKKDIEKLKTSTKNAAVTSPVNGEVQSINADGGTDNNGNALPFMTVVETGGFRVKGYVNENNASVLTQGTAVVIRSRVSDQTWKGSIDSIDWNNAQQTRSDYGDSDTAMSSKYPFYVKLEGKGDGLLMGQHVYIELDQGQEEVKEGLWLYGSYIVQDEDTPYVWAANEKNRLEKRYIELGEYDADMDEYEIVSGLAEDDYIAWPMAGLYEGVTTVTDEAEVDYSSPLYNQPADENLYDTEGVYDTELLYDVLDSVYDTELPDEMYDSMDAGEGTEAEVAE